jgi:hypothetical protein
VAGDPQSHAIASASSGIFTGARRFSISGAANG